MIKYISLLIFFIAISSARAESVDDVLCSKNSHCKKICKIKKSATYQDLNDEERAIMVKCINGIMEEINKENGV
jgi:hypothetical protein